MQRNSVVYWITDSISTDISTYGYVGITNNLKARWREHIKSQRFPTSSSIIVIFEGSRQHCFDIERMLRPTKKTGWNSAPGGQQGFKDGFVHSEETKQKLKSAWTPERKEAASIAAIDLNKRLIGQKRPNQSVAISGANNPMYGKTHSFEARQKISQAQKGQIAHNKSDAICPICNKSTSPFIQKKYHGVGRKNCTGKIT